MLLGIAAGLIVLAALCWLALALVRTWRHVLVVGRGVAEASDRLAEVSAGLEAANGKDPYAW
ncbi:MAG: hypothetical protein ACJ735_13450 [Actinomycetes bacterium]